MYLSGICPHGQSIFDKLHQPPISVRGIISHQALFQKHDAIFYVHISGPAAYYRRFPVTGVMEDAFLPSSCMETVGSFFSFSFLTTLCHSNQGRASRPSWPWRAALLRTQCLAGIRKEMQHWLRDLRLCLARHSIPRSQEWLQLVIPTQRELVPVTASIALGIVCLCR
jgi:hypothetical protein